MDYKFNIETKTVEGFKGTEKVFERNLNPDSFVYVNGKVIDSFIIDEYKGKSVRQTVLAERAFFQKHKIDLDMVTSLFKQNQKYFR